MIGIGNYLFSLKATQTGIYGNGMTGPAPFLILVIWKIKDLLEIKSRTGSWIDLDRSYLYDVRNGKINSANVWVLTQFTLYSILA